MHTVWPLLTVMELLLVLMVEVHPLHDAASAEKEPKDSNVIKVNTLIMVSSLWFKVSKRMAKTLKEKLDKACSLSLLVFFIGTFGWSVVDIVTYTLIAGYTTSTYSILLSFSVWDILQII